MQDDNLIGHLQWYYGKQLKLLEENIDKGYTRDEVCQMQGEMAVIRDVLEHLSDPQAAVAHITAIRSLTGE